jgi:DNA-binding transcriptional LysR family regulator
MGVLHNGPSMRRNKPDPTDYETRVSDVHDLRAFSRASDLRSLTAAAKEIGESTATISRRITRLEKALGTALLRRSPRGIETTEAGALYRLRVGAVLELLGDANAAATHGGSTTPSGQLRVSVPPGLADALAPVLAGFCERFPLVVLVVQSTFRFVDLGAEHIDVALRATSKLADSSLVSLRVGRSPPERILVATPAYLKAHPPPRRPQDLAAHRFLALSDMGAAYTLPLRKRGSDEAIELTLPVAISGSDLGLLKALALAGAGIAVLPRMSVQSALDEGQLVHVLPTWVWPDVNIYLLHRGGQFVPPKIRAFIDYMRSALDLRGR